MFFFKEHCSNNIYDLTLIHVYHVISLMVRKFRFVKRSRFPKKSTGSTDGFSEVSTMCRMFLIPFSEVQVTIRSFNRASWLVYKYQKKMRIFGHFVEKKDKKTSEKKAPRKHRQRVKDIIEALCNKLLDDQALLKLLSQSPLGGFSGGFAFWVRFPDGLWMWTLTQFPKPKRVSQF